MLKTQSALPRSLRNALYEHPAMTSDTGVSAIFLSGDGGWANLDKEIARHLQLAGWNVIGWSSLRYFWFRKTPEKAAHDLQATINHCRNRWGSKDVVLIGFSFGATILPFMVNNLSKSEQELIALLVLLNPVQQIEYRVRLIEMFNGPSSKHALPILPEIKKLPLLATFGQKENSPLVNHIDPRHNIIKEMRGGHHFDQAYKDVAHLILNEYEKAVSTTAS